MPGCCEPACAGTGGAAAAWFGYGAAAVCAPLDWAGAAAGAARAAGRAAGRERDERCWGCSVHVAHRWEHRRKRLTAMAVGVWGIEKMVVACQEGRSAVRTRRL